jgi:hypothetical protein
VAAVIAAAADDGGRFAPAVARRPRFSVGELIGVVREQRVGPEAIEKVCHPVPDGCPSRQAWRPERMRRHLHDDHRPSLNAQLLSISRR